jgi:hypothetical protein
MLVSTRNDGDSGHRGPQRSVSSPLNPVPTSGARMERANGRILAKTLAQDPVRSHTTAASTIRPSIAVASKEAIKAHVGPIVAAVSGHGMVRTTTSGRRCCRWS